jgi:hypothetical protein
MKLPSHDDDLLRRFLHGEADEALVSELGERLNSDPVLAAECARELGFSELIRQALAGADPVEAGRALVGAMESVHLPIEEMLDRVREGSATPFECDQVVKHLWESPVSVRDLRRRLAEEEWLHEAVSSSKSEQAFIESLETRMWAETKQDHFVEDFAKRFEQELTVVPDSAEADNVVRFPGTWTGTLVRLAAAAAAVSIGAFVVAQVVAGRLATSPAMASVMKSTPDAIWVEGASPRDDGTLDPGLYELKSGVVSMRLSGGGELTVEGPARFEVGEDASTEVHAGIALARAPKEDDGIALRSRGLHISDSARLIGIDARAEGATEAIVFNGDGGICLDGSGKCRDLSEFEAVKADHLRDRLVDVPYNPRAFSKAWAMVAGVENNLGPVTIELPGSVISAAGGIEGEVQVFVENESFRPEGGVEVDQVEVGAFAAAEPNPGEALEASGELRSYLVQLTPTEKEGVEEEVETSLTFDHPVVGVIFSSDRLENSDATVGSAAPEVKENRGLDSGEDEILLSEDRRTLNLRFHGGSERAEQVRVLVALN